MSGYVNEVGKGEFEQNVINANQPVLVDFWASWCGPCRALTPVVEAVAQDFEQRAVVVKVNIDDSPELATQYRIQSIPTLVLFNHGAEQERIIGAVAKAEIIKLIERHLV